MAGHFGFYLYGDYFRNLLESDSSITGIYVKLNYQWVMFGKVDNGGNFYFFPEFDPIVTLSFGKEYYDETNQYYRVSDYFTPEYGTIYFEAIEETGLGSPEGIVGSTNAIRKSNLRYNEFLKSRFILDEKPKFEYSYYNRSTLEKILFSERYSLNLNPELVVFSGAKSVDSNGEEYFTFQLSGSKESGVFIVPPNTDGFPDIQSFSMMPALNIPRLNPKSSGSYLIMNLEDLEKAENPNTTFGIPCPPEWFPG